MDNIIYDFETLVLEEDKHIKIYKTINSEINLAHPYNKSYYNNLAILICYNFLASITSIFFIIMFFYYYNKYKGLRNCLTNVYYYIMLCDMITTLFKLISIVKIFDKNYNLPNWLCTCQGFLIILGECSSRAITVYLLLTLYNLFLRNDKTILYNPNKKIISIIIFIFLADVLILYFNQLEVDNQSNIIWCWIKCHDKKGVVNNFVYAIYLYYILVYLVLAFLTSKIYFYLKIISKKNKKFTKELFEKAISNLVRLTFIITLAGGYSLINRILLKYIEFNLIFLYISLFIQISLLDLIPFYNFILVIDADYTLLLIKDLKYCFSKLRIFKCKKKTSINNTFEELCKPNDNKNNNTNRDTINVNSFDNDYFRSSKIEKAYDLINDFDN